MTEGRRCQLFPREIESPRTRPRQASGLREAVVVIGWINEDENTVGRNSCSITMTSDAEPTSSSWIDVTELPEGFEGDCEYPFPVAVLGTSDILMSDQQDAWLYQLELNSWSKLAQMNLERYHHRLSVLYGKVYAIGGTDRDNTPLSSVEVYDRRQNKWTEGIPLPQPRYCHAVAVLDSSIYVMGGFERENTATMYRFSPGDSQWQSMRDMPGVAEYVTATVLNGHIYLAGIQSSIYCYRPSESGGVWT
ncbi:kelch-like protein 24 [Branchiostoma floridae x Branchiostoma japonicum]